MHTIDCLSARGKHEVFAQQIAVRVVYKLV